MTADEVMPFPITMKEAARLLLLQKGSLTYLTEGDQATRESLYPLFDVGDDIHGKTLGGVHLGHVRLQGGGQRAKVKNRAELIAWAREFFPSALANKPGQPTPGQVAAAADVLSENWPDSRGTVDFLGIAEDVLAAALATEDLAGRTEKTWLEALANGEVIKDEDGREWADLPGVAREEVPLSFYVETDKRTIGGVIEGLLGDAGLLALEKGP